MIYAKRRGEKRCAGAGFGLRARQRDKVFAEIGWRQREDGLAADGFGDCQRRAAQRAGRAVPRYRPDFDLGLPLRLPILLPIIISHRQRNRLSGGRPFDPRLCAEVRGKIPIESDDRPCIAPARIAYDERVTRPGSLVGSLCQFNNAILRTAGVSVYPRQTDRGRPVSWRDKTHKDIRAFVCGIVAVGDPQIFPVEKIAIACRRREGGVAGGKGLVQVGPSPGDDRKRACIGVRYDGRTCRRQGFERVENGKLIRRE